jgi:sulfate/thiosulfate transport system substrate-binding protein
MRVGSYLLAGYFVFAFAWIVRSGFIERSYLLNVACDPTRELWNEVNLAFLDEREKQTGQRPMIRQSHGGSASQARSVIDGLDADVVTLALWTDTDMIRRAGLLADGWEDRLPNRSLPFTSTMVMVVRRGNPKAIRDWADLARPDVVVITPNPKTSGNGKWVFLALWGSVKQTGGSDADAEALLHTIFSRVPVLDTSARAATLTFAQKKLGDVHITWENEARLEIQESGDELEIVYPRQSVLAEPHVAWVDRVVDRKGTRDIAEAYLRFLYTPAAQEIIARHDYRPIDPEVLARHRQRFPTLELFSIRDLGLDGDEIQRRFFAEGALFDSLFAQGRR